MKKPLLVALCLVAALALGGCGTAVPDMKGMTLAQASEAIAAAGFEVGQVTYDADANGAVGAVISQQPEAGKRTKEGSLVVLTIAGQPPVRMPDLGGLDAEKAEAALQAVGLAMGDVTESYDPSIADGLLVSQVPSAGTDAPRGSTVAIVISKGPKPVAVPEVEGKTQDAATQALEAAGFKVKVKKKADKAEKGMVIAQKPGGGTAQPGTAVIITVSTGVEMVKVPNITAALAGQSFDAAYAEGGEMGAYDAAVQVVRRACAKAGLVAVIVPVSRMSGASEGQSPAAGATVPKGSKVTVRLQQPGL